MPRGVCVFDLDNTLTCGDAERAVRACRDADYEIAINTARPLPWLELATRAGPAAAGVPRVPPQPAQLPADGGGARGAQGPRHAQDR